MKTLKNMSVTPARQVKPDMSGWEDGAYVRFHFSEDKMESDAKGSLYVGSSEITSIDTFLTVQDLAAIGRNFMQGASVVSQQMQIVDAQTAAALSGSRPVEQPAPEVPSPSPQPNGADGPPLHLPLRSRPMPARNARPPIEPTPEPAPSIEPPALDPADYPAADEDPAPSAAPSGKTDDDDILF